MATAAPCDDGSIGPAIDGCRGNFDFTLLFEQSFLSIMPSSLFLVLAVGRLAVLRSRGRRLVAGSDFQAGKLAAIACYGALQAALLVLCARTGAGGPAGLAAAMLALVDAFALAVLSWFEHAYSPRPSALINVYLLLSVLFGAVQTRTLWLGGAGTVPALFTASLAVKAAVLALESVEKDRFLPAGWCHRSPEEKSGIFSKSLLLWLRRILAQGRRRILSPKDLYALERGLETQRLSDAFWRKWSSERRRASPRAIAWVLVRTLKWPLLAPVIPRLAQGVLTICQPLLLHHFLSYLEGAEGAQGSVEGAGYGFVGAYGLVYSGLAISACFYRRLTYKCLVKMRGCLVAAIYKKTTDIDAAQYDMTAPVALMGTDVERILRGCKDFHEIWANALQAAVSLWLLYRIVGSACAVPAVMAAMSSLGSFVMSPYADRAQRRWMEATQARVGATAKALANIKAVRLLGQSDSIQAMLRGLRAAELGAASAFRLIEVLTANISYAPLLLSPTLTFMVFVMQAGGRPDTTLIFTSLSLLQLMTQPLVWLFQAIPHFIAALGCLGRVGRYLNARQRPERRVFSPDKAAGGGPPSVSAGSSDEAAEDGRGVGGNAITVRNGEFGWTAECPVLREVNVDIPASRLTMVVGPVASGKSTFSKVLIGELPFCKGEVRVHMARASIAYCDQSPFLVNGTLQQNVLGFSDFDGGWYDTVVRAVDLARDMAALPEGGQTRIGSKGVMLSGGQRQRVAIARAVYARTSLAVFDDVLSGLDAVTKEHVFDHVFGPRGLLRAAACTVVLSTHDVDLLPKADHIVALARDGRVADSGTWEHLSRASEYIKSLAIRERAAPGDGGRGARETADVPGGLPLDDEPAAAAAPEDASRRLGDASIYRYLFGHVGLWRTLLFAAYQCGWAVFSTIGPVWLKFWAAANAAGQSRDGYYLGVYGALQGLALVFFGLFTGHTLTTVAVKAGASLHDVLLRTVTAAPLAFLGGVDVGVTTNRFSQDVLLVDGDLPLALLETVSSGLVALVQATLIAMAAPLVAVAYPLVGALLYVVQSFYLRTSRQLRVLELEAKSPLYTHFLETLHGLATIRAFGWAPQNQARSHGLVDASQRPLYLLYMVQRWLQLVLDLLIAATAVVLIALAVRLRATSAELMGVALVNLMSVSAEIKMVVIYWTNLETSLGAVARIKAFAETTPSELKPGQTAPPPPPPWPQTGHVVLDALCARHDASESAGLCLDGVSATIRAGQRVAVCGRSGSGKSSLVMALARMVDLASGSVVIDGVDTSTLSPPAVRAALNMVPQEPCFFHRTVAQNLDPTGAASPGAMRAALEQVRLWPVVDAAGGLDAALDVDTLSQGQRQLLALARALLRPGSIVVLDEATSNVDRHAAAVMQRIVREQFAGRTVIAVAHQLSTVVDFDHVLVMDAGRVVESAPPAELLARDSLFKRLCDMQGVGLR